MRAREFANFNFDIEPYEAWSGEGVIVHAYDGKEEIGHVIFEPTDHDVTQWYAVDVEVEEPYQRLGIATKMYNMAKQAAKAQGAIIVRSHTQTDDGRGLWGDKRVWEQQVNEYKEYPTREYEGVTFTMKEKDGQLIVKPLNDYGISMGHVVFNMDGKILDPQDLVIADKYQGQGIAKVMYDYIKSLGFTIERSWDQTDAGAGFWNKHRGEDVRVWETELDEAFTHPFRIDWEQSEHGDWDALATASDSTPISIMFNNEGDDEWQVEFYRSNTQEITGEGDAQRIFATVLSAIQQFIQKEQPWRLTFSAKQEVEPGQYNTSRSKLYSRMVQRYANVWGYDEYEEDHGDQVVYELTRKK